MKNRQNDTKLHINILLVDLAGATLSIIIAFFIRYGQLLGTYKKFDQIWVLWLILLATVIVGISLSPVGGFVYRGTFKELIDVVRRQLIITTLVILLLYLAHSAASLSRLVFGYFALISVAIIWLGRIALKSYLKTSYKNGSHSTKLVILCDLDRLDRIKKNMRLYGDWEKTICKTIILDECSLEKVLCEIVHSEVDEAFVSTKSFTKEDSFKDFLSELINMGIKVDLDINEFELDIPGHKRVDEVGHYAVVSVLRNEITISRQFIKRAFDILGGIVGFVICLVVGIILGPIIKLDSPGPIIFSQKRVGKNGRIFDFYKFRSMYVDAETRKKELLNQNEVEGLMFKMEDDPRITKIGKFIRKTSLDELPQFWNVLKGDMSLVGTRPPTVDEYERYEAKHKARLAMRPGITGLWQISGRSDIKDFDEVVKLDTEYIDNWSFELDAKILIKTIGVVFTGKGSK